MNRSLYFKFIIGYILFYLLGLFSIKTFISPMLHDRIVDDKGDYLYDMASMIAYNYFDKNMVPEITDYSNVTRELKRLAYLSNSTVWVAGRDGKVLYSSDDSYKPINVIGDFDPSNYLGGKRYHLGDFYQTVAPDTLTTSAPVTRDFSIEGYVILHMPPDVIDHVYKSYLSIIYVTYFVISGLSLIILGIFIFNVHFPLRKINIASKAYSKGHLDYGKIRVNSKDEMGQLAKNLEFMANQLSDLEEYQHKFVANISHDFRSPLTSIKGYVEAILDGTIPSDTQDKYLTIVLNETERLNKLTSNLLTINAWDNKGRKLILSDFDINMIIKDTLLIFEGVCTKRKITFDLILNSKIYMVYADMAKIQQVIYNLIDNAIKFSSNKSAITITVTDRYDKVFISVKDSGIGISKKSLSKIWDRFYKSDQSRGKDKSGSGLGLSITKEIIQSHKENIDVVSTEGVGTEFIFSLPKAKLK